MPSFFEIGAELQLSAVGRPGPDFDGVRRKYLTQLAALTNRPLILYYANWINGARPDTSIALADMQGMMEVLRGLPGPSLDILLHSPGGSAEATESIVSYLRTKFDDIRVFVPLAAMSAATMWALSADRIVMGKHSQLGPIDPQMMIPNASGVAIAMPARAILDQFERAKKEVAENQKFLAAWVPLMQQYGPGLLQMCQTSEELARRLVRQWLEQYMLRHDADHANKAETISNFFADATIHQSHGIGIHRDAAKNVGVRIDDLEADQALQDAVLSVHHAAMHTMNGAGALKVIENHMGRAYVITPQPVLQMMQMPFPIMPQPPPGAVPSPPPGTGPAAPTPGGLPG